MKTLLVVLALLVAVQYFLIAGAIWRYRELVDSGPVFWGFLGTVAFFIGCGATHTEIMVRTIESTGRQNLVPVVLAHIPQVLGGWGALFVGIRYLDVRVVTKRRAEEQRRIREIEEDHQAELIRTRHMASLGELAAGVAHDFNNIIGIIRTYISLLRMRLNDQGTLDDLSQIEWAADSATQISQQLLLFSRQDRTEDDVIYLRNLLDHVKSAIGVWIPSNVKFVTEYDDSTYPVRINPGWFSSALVNVIKNACEAMPDGGTVTLTVHKVQDRVACVIEDTGVGMDQETQDRLFQPFFTGKPPGRGYGLGLSMVYGLVQAAGGTIRVDSIVGTGTRFTILLPIAKAGEIENHLPGPVTAPA